MGFQSKTTHRSYGGPEGNKGKLGTINKITNYFINSNKINISIGNYGIGGSGGVTSDSFNYNSSSKTATLTGASGAKGSNAQNIVISFNDKNYIIEGGIGGNGGSGGSYKVNYTTNSQGETLNEMLIYPLTGIAGSNLPGEQISLVVGGDAEGIIGSGATNFRHATNGGGAHLMEVINMAQLEDKELMEPLDMLKLCADILQIKNSYFNIGVKEAYI